MHSAHIVFATVGSLGDLFPLLAIGQALKARAHRVSVAAHAIHREPVEQAGLCFVDASGIPTPEDTEAFTRRAFHPLRGPRFVVHDFAARDVADSYRLLQSVVAEADVLVTTTLAFAAQILGEQLSGAGRLRWLSVVLAPAGFISAFDPPATGLTGLDHWLRQSPRRARWLGIAARRITHGWTAPVRRFRRDLGLSAVSPLGDPFHAGQHAPAGVLALFPALLGAPQPDWPPAVRQTGFARYQQETALDPALAAFLNAGAAPLVFSLGSTAVHAGIGFLRESLQAAVTLGQRALLFTGSPELRAQLPAELPDGIFAVDYASHAAVFPRAAVTIHHGGIGTSAQALYAGKPMLVVPHGFDQPDNAARLQRMGVAEILPARRYRADRTAAKLGRLLASKTAHQRSAACAEALRGESGAAKAADVIEQQVGRGTTVPPSSAD